MRTDSWQGINLDSFNRRLIKRLFGPLFLILFLFSALLEAATITVTLPGSVREIDAGSVLLTDVASGVPEATASNTNTNSASITTNITTLSNNALLLDVVGSGNGGSFSPGGGQTERWDENNFTATGASSTRTIASAGAASMTQTHNTTSLRNAHAVISLAPASAGGSVAVDSSASGNGQSVTSLNWNHTIPALSSAGKLVVGIAMEEDSGCPSNSDVSSVTYDGNAMTRIITEQIQTSNNFCMRVEFWYADIAASGPASPSTEWRLDESSWNNTPGEIVDSIGGFNGTAFNATTVTGQVCKAGDLSASSVSDYLSMNNGALDGATDFTISMWGKTANSGSQALFSGSDGSQHNELIMWFPNSSTFTPYLKGNSSGSMSITNIADDNWHHLVWTRNGAQNCFYVDSILQGCANKSTLPLGIATGGLIVGQEQDSLGGGFSVSQDWEGLVDEPLIFQSALTQAEITSIYTNQLAGNGWDGTPRSCPLLVAEWRMDELQWNGTAGEVEDATGNGHNGTTANGLTNDDADPAIAGNPGTCRYGDFDGSDDYIQVPGSLPDLTGSFTILGWINARELGNDQRIFADDETNSGGFAFSLGDGGDGKLRFFSRAVSPVVVDTQNAVISQDSWHFVAAVHDVSAKTRQIYVDGTAVTLNTGGTSSTYTGTWGNDPGSASIGGETDSAGGEAVANWRFNGFIDEMRVYQGALSAAEIGQVMSETRPCPGTPRAEWRFDESAWSGAANEVEDSSGNNNHGVAINVSPVPGLVCNAADLTANGVTDYLSMNNSALHGVGDFTLSVWSKNSTHSIGALVSGSSGSQHNELIMWFPSATLFQPYLKGSNSGGSITIPNLADDQWHHYVWTRSGTQNCLYRDGALQNCTTRSGTTLSIATGGLILGQEQDSLGGGFSSGQDWEGIIDELVIFDSVLSAGDIQSIYNNNLAGNGWDGSPRACSSSGPDHIEVVATAAASTCVAKDVIVRACADVACSSLSTDYTGTVNLSTSTGNGNWAIAAPRTVVPNPDDDDNGAASYAFVVADAGTVTLQLSNSHADDLTITATDNADSSLTDTSGTINFRDNAFVITDSDAFADDDLAVAGRNHAYTVTMYQRDTSQVPANCAIAAGYTGNRDLKGWITRTAALPAAATAPQIGAATLPNSVPGANNLSLNFTSGVAGFNLSTSDVGQFAVNLRDDTGSFATAVNIDGSSNDLTVRPFGFNIDFAGQRAADWLHDGFLNDSTGTNLSYAVNENGSVFARAGETFVTSVSAVVWQSGDDADDDGVPDTGANLTDNAVTARFGQEQPTAEQVAISHSLVAPGGGSAGVYTGTPVSGFSAGSANVNSTWSEVGIILLAAQLTDSDYLGTGANVAGSAENVGRFIPDRFELTGGSISEACGPGGFTYMRQDIVADYTLTAKSVGGATTTNYRDDFVKLDSTLGTLDYGAVDQALPLDLNARLNQLADSFSWNVNGTGDISSDLRIDRAMVIDGPLAADIGVLPTDDDGVNITAADLDLDTDLDTVMDKETIAQSDQRYGRFVMDNAFGPEVLDLAVPLRTEYWNGTSFITNADDTACSGGLFASGDFVISDPDLTDSLTPASLSSKTYLPITVGEGALILGAPNASGPLNIDLDVPLWLEFDVDGDSTPDDPSAEAHFGQYRGNDRIIYWRELF